MKRSRKKLKKRTGSIGPIISIDGNAEFHPIKFPLNKEEIEQYIIVRLIKGMENSGENFYNLVEYPSQNTQDDFDFKLTTNLGTEYLELMEIAPLEKLKALMMLRLQAITAEKWQKVFLKK